MHVAASGNWIRALQLKGKKGYRIPTGAPSVVNTTGPTRSGALFARESTPRQEDDWRVYQQQEQFAGAGQLRQVSHV